MNYLPSKLTKLRKYYNYSQSYLANILDVDTFEYMGYENGNKVINYKQMKKLANLYHLDFIDIFSNSDEVTLHDKNKTTTDELNLEYFLPKRNLLNISKQFVLEHRFASITIVSLVIIIIVLSFLIKDQKKPYEVLKENINRLSVSETTVLYIDDFGGVNGSGSNTNGELSNLTANKAIKVSEGEGFSIILTEDGKVSSSGLISKYEEKIREWKNIVDIASGRNYVAAIDNNGRVYCVGDSLACDLVGTKNIKKIFALADGLIVMDNQGKLASSGTFIGSSSLKDYSNVIDIASSKNLLAILTSEKKLKVYSNNGTNYLKAESWNDLVDVACGDDFVAALDSYGKVHIEIINDEIVSEVNSWSEIIAIDAGSNYLIGFDGKKVYGVGKNNYNQFEQVKVEKQTLEKVSNVQYVLNDDEILISFDGVKNASGYLVSIDVGTGLSSRIDDEEIVKFETANMIDGKTYNISIVSIGTGDYKDSDVYKLSFVYVSNVGKVNVNLSQFIGKSKKELEAYLLNIGVSKENISSIVAVGDCNEDGLVTGFAGLEDGLIKIEDLKNIKVEYAYCMVQNDEE